MRQTDCEAVTDFDVYVKQLVAKHAIQEGSANCLLCASADQEVRLCNTVKAYYSSFGVSVGCITCGMDYPTPTPAMLEVQA